MSVTTCAVPRCDTQILAPKRICSECLSKLPNSIRAEIRDLWDRGLHEQSQDRVVTYLSRWGEPCRGATV
jgi:hypothetical protein